MAKDHDALTAAPGFVQEGRKETRKGGQIVRPLGFTPERSGFSKSPSALAVVSLPLEKRAVASDSWQVTAMDLMMTLRAIREEGRAMTGNLAEVHVM